MIMQQVYFITGGCGFIGSNFIKYLFHKNNNIKVVNLDKLTYAGTSKNLIEFTNTENYVFIKGDIGDKILVNHILEEY